MRKFIVLVVVGLASFSAKAQTKIGYADAEYILSLLPEYKAIESDLKTLQTQLKNQVDAKYTEFQKKLKDYNDNINTMLAPVRENTERELQQLQQNLEKLQQDAQTAIQNKQQALMAPVYQKIGKGIEDVAKENGYSLILSNAVGGLDVVLYGDEKIDVSDLVLKKLGVTPPAKTATTTTTPATTTKP